MIQLARCRTGANGATCPHAHLLYSWGGSSTLTEGLLERAIKFAGSRPQVTALAKCLAMIWPPCGSHWLCLHCSMPIRWAWVDVVSKWVMAKMLEAPTLEERNARTLCDPQTGTIWVIAIAKEWPVSWNRKSFQHRYLWALESFCPYKCLLKRFQCKAFRHTKGVMSFNAPADYVCDTKIWCRPGHRSWIWTIILNFQSPEVTLYFIYHSLYSTCMYTYYLYIYMPSRVIVMSRGSNGLRSKQIWKVGIFSPLFQGDNTACQCSGTTSMFSGSMPFINHHWLYSTLTYYSTH